MSIFKETLEDSIQTQLRARTLIVRGVNDDNPNNIIRDNRSGLLPWYLSKNAWVKMSSFTDFSDGPVYFNGSGSVLVDTTKGNYEGNELSKKYVLFGGSLYFKSGSNLSQEVLRYGVATPNAAYGGNIDKAGKSGINHPYFRQMGIRPMPGITGVELRTLGAYGSIFETTIKFNAWDTHQLNELEVLFMRPGYSVLLEWGWSQYLNYDDNLIDAKTTLQESQVKAQSYIGGTINPFDSNLTQEKIYKALEDLRIKYRHNYDGMLGYVKNFKWKLRSDGGYDCETVLISMGEVINTIKMSTNSNDLGSKAGLNLSSVGNSYVYDDYENILLSIKAQEERLVDYISGSLDFLTLDESVYSGSWDADVNFVDFGNMTSSLKDNGYSTQATKLVEQPYFKKVISDPNGDNYVGSKYEYITTDVWIALIGSYCNLKIKSKSGTVSNPVKVMVPTDQDYCLAGKDTISVDASICLVKNQGAFAPEFGEIYIEGMVPGTDGINPPVFGRNPVYGNVELILNDANLQFYDATAKNGKIKNILLNVDMLLAVYRSMKSSDDDNGVNMVDYITNVMKKVSSALGGLNNFIVSTAGKNQNTAKIVDAYYLNKQPKDTFYEFDLLGLGSICKSVDIESQIFENQSTIVGIAAQSKANLGDVYNSSQVYLNAGLKDRLATIKGQGEEVSDGKKGALYFSNTKESAFYRKILQLMVYCKDYIVGHGGTESGNIGYLINQTDSSLSAPDTILKQSLLRFDGELGFKALIPFKLRITLEGIGGIVVGQIFRIKQNVIPKNYYDKNLGFVITQINHSLNNNQWETTLETQICILEDNKFEKFITQGRGGFADYIGKVKVLAILYPILVDFIKFQTIKSLEGYLYSSTGTGYQKGASSLVINNQLFSFDQTDVNDYWKYNLQGFLMSDVPNQNSFPLNNFENFMKSWATNWLNIYGNTETSVGSGVLRKDVQFSSTKTVGDVLNWIAGAGYATGFSSTDPDYDGFNNQYIYQVNNTLVLNQKVFYPNNSFSLYQRGMGGAIDINSVITKTPSGPTTFYSLNYNELQSNIDLFLQKAQNTGNEFILRDAFDAYHSGFGIGKGAYTLESFFFPDSYVVYGKSNSLIHSYYDYASTTPPGPNSNNTMWSVQDIPSGTSVSTPAKEIPKIYGRKINWTNDYRYIDDQDPSKQENRRIRTDEYGNFGVPSTDVSDFINNNNFVSR